MGNGTAGRAKALILASLIVSSGGCEVDGPPLRALNPATEAPARYPVGMRVRLDPVRDRVWSLTPTGVRFHDPAGRQPSVEVSIAGWVTARAAYACPPDLALGPKGEVIVTSNVTSTLWKIDPETLAVSEHPLALDADTDKDVGFSALAWSPAQAAYFAASRDHGTMWRIDPLLTKAQKISAAAPVRRACADSLRLNEVQLAHR